jgi:hypothetical protein
LEGEDTNKDESSVSSSQEQEKEDTVHSVASSDETRDGQDDDEDLVFALGGGEYKGKASIWLRRSEHRFDFFTRSGEINGWSKRLSSLALTT